MLEKLLHFSIQRKLFIGLSTVFLIAGGIYSMLRVPVDAVPDITNNQVQVVTVSPSLSPQEVEKLISYPIEMAMANILNVIEIRSVSRFGLSVVTIVFKDKVPILDARQLVNEQIQVVAQELPDGLGIPQLMPITTGLGEIYQYSLEVDKEYQGKYSPADLRTIQDWIVKRQLSGIPGIVEISSFGGYLKQYEVAADPGKLSSLDVSIQEVFDALEANNQNSGGSYIERYNQAYYIRTEGMVKNLEEIEQIVIKRNGIHPVLIKDIGQVREGHATRFGAMTKNGQGEAVGGITLMLKGANSSEVIQRVKERIDQVQDRLPEGIHLKYYLDRSKLVKKTIHTVTKNLIEGGLIVLFVLVLLLGNFRAGLIVASVIPLSLLFAFILMNLFGVSANLMSLGAIDFGIVIDGAVIIVEGVIHHLYSHHKGKTLTGEEMNEIVFQSTRSIFKSAVFGVIIILIVFFPILTLTGIEGKTFSPMAQTVSFAILGALILALTYVPMMASLSLKRKIEDKRTFSDRVIEFLKRSYRPVLQLSLRFKYYVLLITFLVFCFSIWGFTKLGGEFLPQLSEGDLAMQMSLPAGSSLSESIEIATRAESVLMKNFPEVIQIISKIGTAEVPTDPMAVEDADIMIAMKDQEDWESAHSREEMVSLMEEKLTVVTGATFEFTQPIQLRFNELMTGAKSDIAIKIYGEDLDELYRIAQQAAPLLFKIEGAADVKVEKIQGLPQLLIRFDRQKMALYGVNVQDLNQCIRTAFAGESAGYVYEGERKFDLVVRLDEKSRKEADLHKLKIRIAGGNLLPVSELASMEYYNGPMQISRDDTKRRVVIGINVRGRDVESVVNDARELLEAGIKLPAGYYITYGGQFENLKKAKERLSIAIPAALMLILLLLFFTFHSVKYALMIFSAVPLSAIGGIAALAIRGMPFSISAGVGFIALFGVAVLNGIVLIGYYNQLRKKGDFDLQELVEHGAMVRLRPVMMTALVASLGFLPMAISNSAGAEVQKPLATVVIGGLITSTLLTMIILPILYTLFNSEMKIFRFRINFSGYSIFIPLLLLLPVQSFGQDSNPRKVSAEELWLAAVNYHPSARNAALKVQLAEAQRRAILTPGNTSLQYQKGQINSFVDDHYFEINQNLGSLITPFYQSAYIHELILASKSEEAMELAKLESEVKGAWFKWLYAIERYKLMKLRMDFASQFLHVAQMHYETGNQNLLERTVAETQYAEWKATLNQVGFAVQEAENYLQVLTGIHDSIIPDTEEFDLYEIRTFTDSVERFPGNLIQEYYQRKFETEKSRVKLEKSKFFPELSAGYFRQEIDGKAGFDGWQAGISLPLWFLPQSAAVTQARLQRDMALNEWEYQKSTFDKQVANLVLQLNSAFSQVEYYRSHALKQSELLMETANLHYKKEEIDYMEYIQAIQTAIAIRENFLDEVLKYNLLAIQLEFYTR